jgi:hypothetical protein
VCGDLKRGSGCRFGAGRRCGRGDLGVRPRGLRRRAVEGGDRDWQAGPVEQRQARERTTGQGADKATPLGREGEGQRTD